MKLRLFTSFFYVSFGLLYICTEVFGLQCYSCNGSNADILKCADDKAYIKAREGKGDPSLLKTCSSPYDKICYKEVYMPHGTVTTYTLDCGDGKTFSFNNIPDIDYSNLTNHASDGKTVCAGPPDNTFCLTKCDTDFCNGPQLSSAGVVIFYRTILVSLSVMCRL